MPHDVSIQAFREYLLGVRAKNTARKYASYAAEFLRLMKSSGYETFDSIPPGFLSEYASLLSREGKSPATVRVYIYSVKRYLDWVRSKGLRVELQTRPDLPRRDIRMRAVLPQDQFTNYFRQADMDLEEPMRTAVMMLPCCGLRASELVGLRLEHVYRARVKLDDGRYKRTLFLKVYGKGGKERPVPLMEEGVEIITGYLTGWRRHQKGPWLFPRVTGPSGGKGKKSVSDRHLRASLQKIQEPLGMEECTPHTMRRTYVTTLHRKGIDLAIIAKIAGHANVQTTIDHYIATDANDAVAALHNAGSSLTE